MGTRANRKVVLVKLPDGLPQPDGFRVEEEELDTTLGDGEVLVGVSHLSIDPFIRTSLEEVSYHPSVPIGGTVTAIGVGRVLESAFAGLEPGDGVFGPMGVQSLSSSRAPCSRSSTRSARR